jgi:hypothetical protein
MAGVFTWLPDLANSFEKYRVKLLHFKLVPRLGTDSDGAVYAAIDYDATDGNPKTLVDLMNTSSSQRSSVWQPLKIEFDPRLMAGSSAVRYTRPGPLTGVDLKLYDAGKLIMYSNTAGPAVTHEIYVDYDIELLIPQPGLPRVIYGQSFLTNNANVPMVTPHFSVPNGIDGQAGIGGLHLKCEEKAAASEITYYNPGTYVITCSARGCSTLTAPGDPVLTLVAGNGTIEQKEAIKDIVNGWADYVYYATVYVPGTIFSIGSFATAAAAIGYSYMRHSPFTTSIAGPVGSVV